MVNSANDGIIDDQNDDANNDDQNAGNNIAATPNAATGRNTEFADMDPTTRALVDKARAEEKRKLYKKQEEQERQIRDLTAQIQALKQAPAPASADARQSREDKLDTLIASVGKLAESHRALDQRLDSMQNEEATRRRRIDLDRYAADRIAEVRANNEDVIEGLVSGDTEEQIDESVKIARAEWFLAVQKDREKHGRRPQPSVTVQTGGRPRNTPAPVTPNSVEAEDHENIADLTSEAAVRNGDYEKHRTQILGKLKRQHKYGG
jgi:hypothetical protein